MANVNINCSKYHVASKLSVSLCRVHHTSTCLYIASLIFNLRIVFDELPLMFIILSRQMSGCGECADSMRLIILQ